MVIGRNVSSLRRSYAHRNLWRHRRTGAQPRPTPGTPRETTIHPLDDRPSDLGGHDHHWRQIPQMDEPTDEQQPANASLQGNGIRGRQWHSLSTLPFSGKISSRAARSYNRRQAQRVQPLAVMDDTPGPPRSRAYPTLLYASRLEALFHQHIIPLCVLRVQHQCYFRRPYLF